MLTYGAAPNSRYIFTTPIRVKYRSYGEARETVFKLSTRPLVAKATR